jgi:hypothetical protein
MPKVLQDSEDGVSHLASLAVWICPSPSVKNKIKTELFGDRIDFRPQVK